MIQDIWKISKIEKIIDIILNNLNESYLIYIK
jgi:hypothetical protein